MLRSLARRINPRDAGANNNLGVVYYQKDLQEEAIDHFERALELDPRMQVASATCRSPTSTPATSSELVAGR